MRTIHELYHAFRADNPEYPARWAHYMARAEIATDEVLTERTDATTDRLYDVDIDALAQHSGIALFAGSSVVVTVEDDHHALPEGDDCYSDADLLAWQRGRWQHVGVTVTVTLPDGRVGDSSLWNVDVGEYWPGSVEAQLWERVVDLTKDAKAYAEAETARPAVVAQHVGLLTADPAASVFRSADGSVIVLGDGYIVSVDADGSTSSADVGDWTSGYEA